MRTTLPLFLLTILFGFFVYHFEDRYQKEKTLRAEAEKTWGTKVAALEKSLKKAEDQFLEIQKVATTPPRDSVMVSFPVSDVAALPDPAVERTPTPDPTPEPAIDIDTEAIDAKYAEEKAKLDARDVELERRLALAQSELSVVIAAAPVFQEHKSSGVRNQDGSLRTKGVRTSDADRQKLTVAHEKAVVLVRNKIALIEADRATLAAEYRNLEDFYLEAKRSK